MQEIKRTEREKEFIDFQDQLTAFIYRLVTNRQDTEDLTQETYIKAFKKLDTFREESSFKTWVFAIACNLAKDHLRKQDRWDVDYQDNCRTATFASRDIQMAMGNIAMSSPQGKFELKEHIDYCFTCMAKTLPIEEQICLMLKEIFDLKVAEIMHIAQLTEGQVKYALSKSRKSMVNIFDGRCALVHKKGVCHQCSELNGMFNPKQDFQQKALELKMVQEKDTNDSEHLFDLRVKLVKAIDPINADGYDLHNYMLENLPSHSTKK